MLRARVPALVLLALAAACSRGSTTSPEPAAAASATGAPRTSLGNVMVQVGRRFEIAGRAAGANRFDLAAFEVGEIEEMFEGDVPSAEMPKEGPTAHIPAMAKAFLDGNAPALRKAAAARDRAAFTAAFARAAAACNACHQASEKAFIQVPTEPGKAVPDLEPLPAASAAPR